MRKVMVRVKVVERRKKKNTAAGSKEDRLTAGRRAFRMQIYKEWYDADERCAGRWQAGLRVFIHEMVWKFKKGEERSRTRIGKRKERVKTTTSWLLEFRQPR